VINLRFVEDGWLSLILILGSSTPFLMSDDPSLSFERFDVLIPFDKSWGNKRWIHAGHAARSLRSVISIFKLTAATILNKVVLIHIIMLSILINGSLIIVFLAHQHLLAFFFYFAKL
jgi:hypothetical protein